MEYVKTAHSIYHLHYHVVWVCKYRRRILNPGICGYIQKLMPKLAAEAVVLVMAAGLSRAYLLRINGTHRWPVFFNPDPRFTHHRERRTGKSRLVSP
jgi:hypothetical protein